MSTSKTQQQVKAEASRERHKNAVERDVVNGEALSQVDRDIERIRHEWNSGDDTTDSATMNGLLVEKERLEALKGASARELARAERGLISDDTSLADALAPTISDVVGVEAVVCNVLPAAKPDLKMPTLHLVQQKPSDPNTIKGTIAGNVVVHFRRPGPLFAELPVTEIVKALDQRQVNVGRSKADTTKGSDHIEDVLILSIKSAFAGKPILSSGPKSHTVKWFADAVAADTRQAFYSYNDPRAMSGAQKSTVGVWVTDKRLISSEVSGDDRRTIIQVQLVARITDGSASMWTHNDLVPTLTKVVDGRAGGSVTNLGRITDAKVKGSGPGEHGKVIVVAEFTFASRTV